MLFSLATKTWLRNFSRCLRLPCCVCLPSVCLDWSPEVSHQKSCSMGLRPLRRPGGGRHILEAKDWSQIRFLWKLIGVLYNRVNAWSMKWTQWSNKNHTSNHVLPQVPWCTLPSLCLRASLPTCLPIYLPACLSSFRVSLPFFNISTSLYHNNSVCFCLLTEAFRNLDKLIGVMGTNITRSIKIHNCNGQPFQNPRFRQFLILQVRTVLEKNQVAWLALQTHWPHRHTKLQPQEPGRFCFYRFKSQTNAGLVIALLIREENSESVRCIWTICIRDYQVSFNHQQESMLLYRISTMAPSSQAQPALKNPCKAWLQWFLDENFYIYKGLWTLRPSKKINCWRSKSASNGLWYWAFSRSLERSKQPGPETESNCFG